ncbi:MAG: restriction endonuclease subunit S [Bacteroidaceae bacterium]|nr:restriction endonuclease subunit S [Bacteroidaceae bacterium]
MKQGWEIKKLGEVCEVIGGSTPKTNEESYWGGEHFWISPAELDGSKYVYSTSRTITDEGVRSAHLQMLPIGTVLLSSRAPIGKVAITKVPMYCNQGFKNLICKNEVINEYVYWFLSHSTNYLNSLGTGATFKEISKKVVEQVSIPVPPLPEQEKIVAELDCLSGIIEKKKQQLKELDALAQSIFYEMFGDPVTNEKGWEVKKLGEVASDIFAGGDKPKDISDVQTEEYAYPVYANGDGEKGLLGYSRKYRVASKAVTIGARGASIGNCRICNERFTPVVRLITIVPGEDLDIIFLYHSALKMEFDINGAGQAQLTIPNVVSKCIILPPLPLQQTFASKIEAIEKQKELIKQSINEVETLFNSRMQEYFG